MTYVLRRLLLCTTLLSCSAHSQMRADLYQPSQIPPSVVELVRQAHSERLAGSLDKSAQTLEGVVKSHPNYFLGHYQLGLTYQAQGKSSEALVQIQEALRLNEQMKLGEPTIQHTAGSLYLTEGKYEQAVSNLRGATSFENLSQLDGSARHKVLTNLALAYAQAGRPCDAGLYYKLAEQIAGVRTADTSTTSLSGWWIVQEWNERSTARAIDTFGRRKGPPTVSGTLNVGGKSANGSHEGELSLCANDAAGTPARKIRQGMAITVDQRRVTLRGKLIEGRIYWTADVLRLTWSGNELTGRAGDSEGGSATVRLTRML